jgi:two-component system cell cycle sensor histidine kinase PleC
MTAGVRRRLTLQLVGFLTPKNRIDAEIRIELLRVVARIYRPAVIFVPVSALIVVVNDLRWASFDHMLGWLLLVVPAAILPLVVNERLLRSEVTPEEAGLWTMRSTLAALPLQIFWPCMIVFAWNDGNAANNAFMLAFLCSGLVVGAALSAPSLHQALLGVAVNIPLLAYYTVDGVGSFSLSGVATQVGFGLVVGGLAYNMHKVAAEAVRQRLEKESLVARLAEANRNADLARMRAEDANRAKSAFLASMSHDLRTPLNAVIGFSDLIRSGIHGPLAPARYAGYIEDIHSSGRHLLSLINDVLDLAKIEAGGRELEDKEVALGGLVAEALNLVEPQAAKAGIELRKETASGVGLRSDERALLQILTNLLSNAVKFTPAGGSVTVFAVVGPAGGLMLGVEDTGIGIDKDDLRKVMEPFAQVNVSVTVEGRGTGLGLPIVRGLVEALGGSFRLESEPGRGTRAWAEFPSSHVLVRRAIA